MSREDWLLYSLWVHVPFIVAWIGIVMLDFFAVFAPGMEESQRARILLWSRAFVVVAIPVIMITGIWQTMENPFTRVDSYSDLKRLRANTLYGDLLFWKHVFVVATFGLTVIVRFFLAPKWRDSIGGGDVVASGGGAAVIVGQRVDGLIRLATAANLVACLGAILLATRMVAELH
jgi:hypothetical protein